MSKLHELYIVTDIETNQIEENSGFMLEIAAAALDENLETLDTFHTLIDPGFDVGEESMYPPAVWEMHTKSGLIEEHQLSEGIPTYVEASELFVDWAKEFDGDDERRDENGNVWPRKGVGNNFGEFDLKWLRAHMPTAAEIFHYRPINISSLREVAANAIGVDQRSLKELSGFGNHRAMDDVRCCVAEFRHYREMMVHGCAKIVGKMVNKEAS